MSNEVKKKIKFIFASLQISLRKQLALPIRKKSFGKTILSAIKNVLQCCVLIRKPSAAFVREQR